MNWEGECAECHKQSNDLVQCPCEKFVCPECADNSIYTDVTVCSECAAEVRQGWEECEHAERDEPYASADGAAVAECKKCGHPKIISNVM